MQARGKSKAGRVSVMLLLALFTLAACRGPALSPEETVVKEMNAMRAAIPAVVMDAARARQLQQKVNELQREIDDFDAALLLLGKDLRQLNADPDAHAEQFAALFSRFDERRLQARHHIMKTHFDMLALTTAQEWKVLAKYEREALVVVVKLQGGE